MLPSFTINLVSNSSMQTFSTNTLASFTTLLPHPIELPRQHGTWQVSLLEISWPARVKNVTNGLLESVYETSKVKNFDGVEEPEIMPSSDFVSFAKISRRNHRLTKKKKAVKKPVKSPVDSSPERHSGPPISEENVSSAKVNNDNAHDDVDEDDEVNFSNGQPRHIYEHSPPNSPAAPSQSISSPPPSSRHSRKLAKIDTGHYVSIEQLADTVLTKAFKTSDKRAWPFTCYVEGPSQLVKCRATASSSSSNQRKRRSSSIDGSANDLQMKTTLPWAAAAAITMPHRIDLISTDLQNIFGVRSLKSTSTLDSGLPALPVDIYAGRHTMFVYTDLIHGNEILGDRLTSLLRTIPLDQTLNTNANVGGTTTTTTSSEPVICYRSFAKLQWKNVVKSSIESIKVSLIDEGGNFMPFLSIGRTCLTLQFRQLPFSSSTTSLQ